MADSTIISYHELQIERFIATPENFYYDVQEYMNESRTESSYATEAVRETDDPSDEKLRYITVPEHEQVVRYITVPEHSYFDVKDNVAVGETRDSFVESQ